MTDRSAALGASRSRARKVASGGNRCPAVAIWSYEAVLRLFDEKRGSTCTLRLCGLLESIDGEEPMCVLTRIAIEAACVRQMRFVEFEGIELI
jgi:hypothetical protein